MEVVSKYYSQAGTFLYCYKRIPETGGSWEMLMRMKAVKYRRSKTGNGEPSLPRYLSINRTTVLMGS